MLMLMNPFRRIFMQTRSTRNTKKMVGIAILGAMSFILINFSFPIVPGVSFLKVDFSDMPSIIGMFLYGPVGGIAIAFIRSLLHYVQTGGDAGFPIGDFTSFVASVSYLLPLYWVVRKKGTSLNHLILGSVAGTLTLTAVLSVLNYYVVAPLYMWVLNFDVGPMMQYVLYGVLPFNLAKGFLISVVFIVLFGKLKPWLLRNGLYKLNIAK